MRLKLIFLIVFLTASQFAMAQIKFVAKASKNKLGVNERLRIDFEMNKDGDNFTPPSFSGFTVVGGPNQSITDLSMNGKKLFIKRFSYFIEPKQKGRFTIKQATIEIDGQTYKTLPIKIQVTSSVNKPKNNNEFDVNDYVHLVTEVSKPNPYLNEAIMVNYKLYVSPQVNAKNLKPLEVPKYRDFWSQEIEVNDLRASQDKYEGQPYYSVVVRRDVLYPQKTGKVAIEPFAIGLAVGYPTKKRDRHTGDRIYSWANTTLTANRRTIDIKSLPIQGKPDDFSGAVGAFDFKVTTNKTELDATESLDAKVVVSGNGNLKLLDMPKLSIPNGLEQYEPEHKESIRTTLSGMRGNISDNYTLVPQYKGEYSIPAISFSYFDLKTESYKRITTDEILITARTGPDRGSIESTAAVEGVNKRQVTQTANQFRFLKSKANLKSIEGSHFFKSTTFWVSLTAPLLVIPIFLFFGKKREERLSDVSGNRVRKADKLARKYLSEAKRNLGSQKEFYIAMELALHNYLKAKLHIQTSDMSKDRMQRLLKEREVDDALAIEFIAVLESCEFARYTPSSTSAMQQDYDKASRVIGAIDKQL